MGPMAKTSTSSLLKEALMCALLSKWSVQAINCGRDEIEMGRRGKSSSLNSGRSSALAADHPRDVDDLEVAQSEQFSVEALCQRALGDAKATMDCIDRTL